MTNQNSQEAIAEAYQNITQTVAELESQTYLKQSKRYDILMALVRLSNELDTGANNFLMQRESQASMEIATRLANIVSHIILDLKKPLQLDELTALCLLKRFIADVYECSGMFKAGWLIDLLHSEAEKYRTKRTLQNDALIRAIAISSINELKPNLLVELSIEQSEVAALLTLGLLLDRMPITTTGEANRNYLLESANPFEALSPYRHYKTVMANIWMRCSYSNSPKKHDIKVHLNQWYKRMLKERKLHAKPTGSVKMPGNTENKPVMVVMAESFSSNHAMYRWYSPLIKRLKNEYYLVLMALEADIDEKAKTLFDHYLPVPTTELDLQPLLDQCTPDIVYYPSIGMRSWSIYMANMRWAPLQVMGQGHPATSRCDTIDAVLTNTRVYAGEGVNSENLLVMNAETGTLISHIENLVCPAPPELPNDEIHIAVPCNVMKLNWTFMTALKEIERLSEKPIRYTFFPNVAGLTYRTISLRIREFFPNAIIARRKTYQGYLDQLNEHHFALNPFPFGNASTAIDSMILNQPFIALIGREPHARTEYAILCEFELEDFFIADSLETYVAAAANWVNNTDLLPQLKDLIASKDFVNRSLTKTDQHDGELSHETLKAIQWAYNNRELLTAQQGKAYFAEGNWA